MKPSEFGYPSETVVPHLKVRERCASIAAGVAAGVEKVADAAESQTLRKMAKPIGRVSEAAALALVPGGQVVAAERVVKEIAKTAAKEAVNATVREIGNKLAEETDCKYVGTAVKESAAMLQGSRPTERVDVKMLETNRSTNEQDDIRHVETDVEINSNENQHDSSTEEIGVGEGTSRQEGCDECPSRVESDACLTEIAEVEYLSSYEERLKQTPVEGERGHWTGERGESKYVPSNGEVQQLIALHDADGVEYTDAIPDFSPFAESTVKIEMTQDRHNRKIRNSDGDFIVVDSAIESADQRLAETWSLEARDGNMNWSESDVRRWRDDNHYSWRECYSDGRTESQLVSEGNFEKSDRLCAEQWNADARDGKTDWTARDVADWRDDNNYTWHECNDRETCQLVPIGVNDYFGHLGGVGECKKANSTETEVFDD